MLYTHLSFSVNLCVPGVQFSGVLSVFPKSMCFMSGALSCGLFSVYLCVPGAQCSGVLCICVPYNFVFHEFHVTCSEYLFVPCVPQGRPEQRSPAPPDMSRQGNSWVQSVPERFSLAFLL